LPPLLPYARPRRQKCCFAWNATSSPRGEILRERFRNRLTTVVEADDIDSVRDFALQSRLMQWNTVKIHATYSMEEALPLIDSVEPIF
jgi:hypothetical protein